MTTTEKMEQRIMEAASRITDLWWARPDQNGHIKTLVVADIIREELAKKGSK
jgi:hypothetical protein